MPRDNFEEKGAKAQKFFKDNISNLAVLVIAGVYTLFGIVTMSRTGKTIPQILLESSLALIMGVIIKTLLTNQGMTNGENSKVFLSSKEFYSSVLERVSPYTQYLYNYCEFRNARELKKRQTDILTANSLKYDDLVNDTFNYERLSRRQIKAIKRAKNFKINRLTETILLSDLENNVDRGDKLDINKRSFLKENFAATFITMAITSLIFGYYSIDPNKGFNWYGAIYNLLQISTYIGFGVSQYFKGYTFITDRYRNALIRKAEILEEFLNMYNENPERFKDKVEEKVEVKNEETVEIVNTEENKIEEMAILIPKEEKIKTFEEICKEQKEM